MSNKVSAQQLDATPRNRESTHSEKAAFATQNKDRVQQTDRMRPADFQAVQLHWLRDTVPNDSSLQKDQFPQLTCAVFLKALHNLMLSCITITKS